MCADDTSLDPTPENDDNTSETPQDTQQHTPEDTSKSGPIWSWPRRKFLAAAALGTAAAALIGKDGGGLQFGALSASAAASGTCPDGTTPDLSFLSCTANDVTVAPVANVLNEPCQGCGSTSTFGAVVQFSVTNHTGTGRYCIQISIGSGLGVDCQDVILHNSLVGGVPSGSSTVPANTTTTMYGLVTGFPCDPSGGLVCLGAANTPASGACPGECVTVGWSTSSGSAGCTSPTKVPGGQCRHQQICIQGYGASLTCKSGCTPTCGGTSVLTAAVSGGTAPYTFLLHADDGSADQTAGPTSSTSVDFTVTVTKNTNYLLKVTDKNGCFRTASTSLSANPLAAPTAAAGSPDCFGKVTLTASPSGLASYTWFDGTTQIGTVNPLTVTLAPGDHSITVTATNTSGCSNTSAPIPVHINAQLAVSLVSAGGPGCDGVVNLTATASGGSGTYSSFTVSGVTATVTGSGSTRTLTIQPLLTGASQTATISVLDSNGCTATSGPVTWSSCVTTTFS